MHHWCGVRCVSGAECSCAVHRVQYAPIAQSAVCSKSQGSVVKVIRSGD